MMVPQIDWSDESIEMFKAAVVDAESLSFQTKYVEDGCCYGQLFAINDEQRINISDILIKNKESIELCDYLYGA